MTPVIQQRIIIGTATLIVVMLTIMAAVFLALQDRQQVAATTATPTATVEVATLTPTKTLPAATATLTPVPLTDTPTATVVPPTATSIPSTATSIVDTPTVTNTPLPPTATTIPNSCSRTPASWVTYTVERYETWDSLSRRVNISVFDLQQGNCSTNTLQTGQTVYVPFAPPTPTPTDTVTLTPTPQPTATSGRIPTATLPPIQPKIESLNPRVGTLGQEVHLIVQGKNFGLLDQSNIIDESNFKVELRMVEPTNAVTELSVVNNSRTSTSFEVLIPADLAEGCYSLVVINPDGRLDIVNRAYTNNVAKFPCAPDATPTLTPTATSSPTVTSTPNPPRVTTCTPSSGQASQEVELTCTGQNFKPTDPQFKVELQTGGGPRVTLQVSSGGTNTTFNAIIPANLSVGKYDLIVTNPDKQTDIRQNIYEVK